VIARPQKSLWRTWVQEGSLTSVTWFALALFLFAIEARRPGKYALWLGFAAILVGIIASVARWPWLTELAAFAVFAAAMIPIWRRYERKA
jgi:membrane protein implicated in regulation of membrane protease activity